MPKMPHSTDLSDLSCIYFGSKHRWQVKDDNTVQCIGCGKQAFRSFVYLDENGVQVDF
jgi:hypothetical protein